MNEKEMLSRRIQYYCKLRRLTYYKLSHRSAVPINTVMHIVNGATENPGIFTIAKLCSGLGISLKEFFDTDEFVNMEFDLE